MVKLQQSQEQLEDEATICTQVIGRSAGTTCGIGLAPRKSCNTTYTSLPRFIQELEALTK